jgi:formylglycine-generating enzyme required for sulfatase activity
MKRRPWLIAGCIVLGVVVGVVAAEDKKPADDESTRILKLFKAEFVDLPPGNRGAPRSFRMGSADTTPDNEKPAHTVTFARPFAMAKYEVTQELYQAVAGKNPSRWKGVRNSVEMVNWQEATDFCQKVTAELQQRKLITNRQIVRLPSEAEWEYACRAGSTKQYAFGDSADDLKDYAWFKGNSKGEDPPVGKKKPNAWGLCDMHGYVWEWCLDAWHPNYEGAPSDGSAWDEKDARERVIRGGSWNDSAESCRSAYRQRAKAGERSDTIGFRCVLIEQPPK